MDRRVRTACVRAISPHQPCIPALPYRALATSPQLARGSLANMEPRPSEETGSVFMEVLREPPNQDRRVTIEVRADQYAEAQSNLAQAYLSPHYDYENPPSFLSPPDEGASRTKRVRNTYTSVNRTNMARRKSAPRSSSRNGLSASGAGPSVARQPQGSQGSQSNPDRYDRRACAQELQGISLLFCSTWR
jgi:hypothetical protein